MKPEKLETWTWVLLYGGLLAVSLGVFVLLRGGVLGWPLVALGVVAVVVGLVFIVVRSRMSPPPAPPAK
jgi:hypothetical protein